MRENCIQFRPRFRRWEPAFRAVAVAVRGGCTAGAFFAVALVSPLLFACDRASPQPESPLAPRVVLYTSVDEEFAKKIVAEFEKKSGIRVESLYDTEGGKTTGFVRRLERESAAPLCDVWWSSEVFGTIELARYGVFAPYDSSSSSDIPSAWKDPGARWTGTAARARVLAYNTQRFKVGELPQTWRQLALSKRLERFALANPQFGTTRGHIAACFAMWGDKSGREFLQALRDQYAQLADGNSHVVRLIASGAADFGMTDTDDAWIARDRGEPVAAFIPSIDEGLPPLWIPCTVALIRNGPNPSSAKQLIDFLVSGEVEKLLAESDSRNVPVRKTLRDSLKLDVPVPQAIDYAKVADSLLSSGDVARELLLR